MIHEEVKEELNIGNRTYLIEGCHRDWNMLEGHEAPEGTVWELIAEVEGQKVAGAGGTKNEAIQNLIFVMGFTTGVRSATLGPNRPV
tara:strand:- start:1027 stop:1287 length:261 start_codon:yes stop_codon:yes gene_type:complete